MADNRRIDRECAACGGQGHDAHHRMWSRRDFLSTLLGATATVGLSLYRIPLYATAPRSGLPSLLTLNPDRRLVLIQLKGGNDGFNTIVPVQNDLYYNLRPNLAIAANQTVPLNGELGMHSAMSPLQGVWGEGQMAVIQGAGYPDASLSHFESTDIWTSASTDASGKLTGWIGNALDLEYPDFLEQPPEYPLALRVGGPQPLLFQGPSARMGIAINNAAAFDRLVSTGTLYDEEDVPPTFGGEELAFVRRSANEALTFGRLIQEAAAVGQNRVEYPDNPLGSSLAIVSQMIKGGLQTQIYLVELGGFDTHGNQVERQEELLADLSLSVQAFFSDLEADDASSDVLALTFSEFGRRPYENGSGGTDHGTAAPMFAVGPGVNGGIYSDMPLLDQLDPQGNVAPTIDFRSVYATTLVNWMGMTADDVALLLGASYELVDFVSSGAGTQASNEAPERHLPLTNYPNPFGLSTTIAFSLERSESTRLSLFDVQGRHVVDLASGQMTPGRHTVHFDASNLPVGAYVLRLDSESGSETRIVTVAR
ncbi:MAG TPA: DUF1501 domain-containing protein [Rhodothermia bacterium]